MACRWCTAKSKARTCMALFVAMPEVMVPLPGMSHIMVYQLNEDWNGQFHLGRRLFDQSPLVTILLKVQPVVNIKYYIIRGVPITHHCQRCRQQGWEQGQFALGPQCKGAPKQCKTCSNKICSSVTFQSSFFKGLVLLNFWLKSACSCFMLLTQIILRGYCIVR